PMPGTAGRWARVVEDRPRPGGNTRNAAVLADPARAHRARQVARERIVATGIEKNDVGLGFTLHLLEHKIQLDGLKIEIPLSIKLGIRGYKIVDTTDLQAMPGVKEDTNVGTFKRAHEITCLEIKPPLVEIEPQDHGEA